MNKLSGHIRTHPDTTQGPEACRDLLPNMLASSTLCRGRARHAPAFQRASGQNPAIVQGVRP